MKKMNIKHVFGGFRSSSAQQSSNALEHIPVPESLKSEYFQVSKTVRHGFPYQPTVAAFDPVQKILAIGTKHGSVRFFGRPGVGAHVRHEAEVEVTHLAFLVNEGALVSATADNCLHMWNYRQKRPEIVHTLKFQRERITSICLPFQSKWMYVGSERGNVHVVNIESFTLSGYVINWNKAIDLSRKTHPGPVIHLSDCPIDPGKLLIGFTTGQLVVWDLKVRTADCRYQAHEILHSASWHHEGKQFMCSHSDGSLTTWLVRGPTNRPTETTYPYATTKEPTTEHLKPIVKVKWTCNRAGESIVMFHGGRSYSCDKGPTLTIMAPNDLINRLEFESNIVEFIPICDSPYPYEVDEPFALIVLLAKDLYAWDMSEPGNPVLYDNPYSIDISLKSPVTCCTYLADCPADLIPALYSAGAGGGGRKGRSPKEWPISGGEWSNTSRSYPELIITGHADGTVKFWDATSVGLQILYKLRTAKVFEDASRSSEDEAFAVQHISLCPESRILVVAGASSHVMLYRYCKTENLTEVKCLEIPIVYEPLESGDFSPDSEFPPRNPTQTSLDTFVNVQVRAGPHKKAPGYQPELVCLTPWVNGDPPGLVTSLAVNSAYGLLAYGNESGLVVVDYLTGSCLLSMGTPELYGAADPYQRAPRSPGRKGDDDRSPSCEQVGRLAGEALLGVGARQAGLNLVRVVNKGWFMEELGYWCVSSPV